MPELPEVEVILNHLNGHVLGGIIETFTIHRSDIVRTGQDLIPWLQGSTITTIARKGKCLIFTCQRSNQTRYLLSELGMTGLWYYHHTLASSPQHLHCRIGLSGAQAAELHYWNPRRFGRLWLFALPELEAFMQRRFGSDALDIGEQPFVQLIQSCRGRLKPFFLDQHRLAGIGNIYANEILFRARIHPQAHGYRLGVPSCQRLYRIMHMVLREAIAAGGSSIRDFRAPDGSQGHFQEAHQVYQKAGLRCSHGCPALIKRMQSERSSFYCPACQKRR
jgi:formamidopyrimidine-DNA glycosylase